MATETPVPLTAEQIEAHLTQVADLRARLVGQPLRIRRFRNSHKSTRHAAR